ncbi:MAG: ABC transporter ATP-binding protein [Candidatus Edwardsbacteria bacterium]|nr:ABC transporter ATP-binding protein [Candidatus Edwardsbacteria bacterium]
MEAVIQIKDLTKMIQPHFWSKRQMILQGLDLEVHSGEIFGFLGPNGAGKTTTIKSLMGIIGPTSGQIRILGSDPRDTAVKQQVGYLPETPYFYDYLTGREFLTFCGDLFEGRKAGLKEKIGYLLALVRMEESADRQLRKYSKGMLQRIGLAQALINDPKLVVLDEPLTGLDPMGRKEFKDIIAGLREKGTTVFFSSHILPDAETICDRVAIINKGKVLKVGRLDELLDAKLESVELICRGLSAEGLNKIQKLATGSSRNGDEYILTFPDMVSANTAVKDVLASGGQVVSLNPLKESLEEYFAREVSQDA